MVDINNVKLFRENYLKASSKFGCFKKIEIHYENNGIVILLFDEDNNVFSLEKFREKGIKYFKTLDSAKNVVVKLGFSDFTVRICNSNGCGNG